MLLNGIKEVSKVARGIYFLSVGLELCLVFASSKCHFVSKRCCVGIRFNVQIKMVLFVICKIELFLSWLCCVLVCNISCCSIVTLGQWHFWCGAQSKAPARINKGQKISNNSWLQQYILHSAVCWPLLPILQHFLGRISPSTLHRTNMLTLNQITACTGFYNFNLIFFWFLLFSS